MNVILETLDRSAAAMGKWSELRMSLIVAFANDVRGECRMARSEAIVVLASRHATSLSQNKRFSIARRPRHRASTYSGIEGSTR